MKWIVETLNEVVDAEVEALPADMRARLSHIASLIEEMGLERVGEPHVKHLESSIWEMRLTGRSGISRALYVVATGRRVVIVRAFNERPRGKPRGISAGHRGRAASGGELDPGEIKKTQKTPRREIELALARAKTIQ